MSRSLSVLLPVRNVQSTLAATISDVLDVVSEVTRQFEVVIIDDGSIDATCEVAVELTHLFPQVRFLSHRRPLGREAAIRTGLEQSSGEIILLGEEDRGWAIDELPRLWRAAQQQPAVDLPEAPAGPKWPRFSAPHTGHSAGYQLLDRRSMERVHGWSRPVRPNYLSRSRDLSREE